MLNPSLYGLPQALGKGGGGDSGLYCSLGTAGCFPYGWGSRVQWVICRPSLFFERRFLGSLLLFLLKTLHRPAFRKRRASPKLLPRLRPCLHRAYQQRTATFRALPLSCWIATALEVLHMLAVCGESRRAAAGLQGVQHGVDFSLAEYRLLE